MLLRTEELKHVPSHWFKIRSQSQSPPRKLVLPSISFLSDFKCRKWSYQDLSVGPTITDCHGLRVVGVLAILNTGLHNPTLCQPSTWEGREEGSVTVCRSHVQPKLSSYSNTGHEHSGEDSFLLFPCQMKHRAPSLEKERKKKNPNPTSQSEAPLAVISTQQGAER